MLHGMDKLTIDILFIPKAIAIYEKIQKRPKESGALFRAICLNVFKKPIFIFARFKKFLQFIIDIEQHCVLLLKLLNKQ
jgi:hypothetical protein